MRPICNDPEYKPMFNVFFSQCSSGDCRDSHNWIGVFASITLIMKRFLFRVICRNSVTLWLCWPWWCNMRSHQTKHCPGGQTDPDPGLTTTPNITVPPWPFRPDWQGVGLQTRWKYFRERRNIKPQFPPECELSAVHDSWQENNWLSCPNQLSSQSQSQVPQ